MLSPYPENVRRRLKRALRRLAADRKVFLAKYIGHVEAEKAYDRETARLNRELLETYSRRWRKRLARLAAS